MEITVINHLGKSLVLDPINFPVVSVDGITPSGATINTSGAATVDGTFFNSSYMNKRNIVLTITPNCQAEKARLKLYEFFKPKYNLRLIFKTKYRNVYIEGYVETFEGSLYEVKQSFQISIICPQPFFVDMNVQVIKQSTTLDVFSFPFSTTEEGIALSTTQEIIETVLMNDGEETTGAIIKLIAKDIVLEPTLYNKTTRETFTVKAELEKGETITIDTRRGHKTITFESKGVETNILNRITKGSKWFQYPAGENILTFSALYGADNLVIEYYLSALYGGL